MTRNILGLYTIIMYYVTESESLAIYVIVWFGKSAGRKLCTTRSRPKTSQKKKVKFGFKVRGAADK